MDYTKTNWKDHIVDVDTEEVIQHGTPQSARNFNNMEDGISKVTKQSKENKSNITSMAVEVATLKNASLINMTNNVFFENLENLDNLVVTSGVYDEDGKRLYV